MSGPVSASTSSIVKSHLDREMLHGAAEETADAIGNEVGRILARHHALAQMPVGEIGDAFVNRGLRLGTGDHFEQMQIAGRIEEVRSQEILAELAGESFGDTHQRNAAGVSGEDGAGLAMSQHLLDQRRA